MSENTDRGEIEVEMTLGRKRQPSTNPWASALEAWAETAAWLGFFAMICVIVYLNVRY
jgi:hypothetical protein